MTSIASHSRHGQRDTTSDVKESGELLKTLEAQTTPDVIDLEKHDEDSLSERQPSCTIIEWNHDDPDNPYNWSTTRKIYIVCVCIVLVVNSTLGSTLSGDASGATREYFGVTSEIQLVLPTSMYLAGYSLGPLVFAPLSESYGRRTIMIGTFVLYTAFVLGCALAPTWTGLIVMRLLAGIGASTPISVVGGVFADIYDNPSQRGDAMAAFMTVTLTGALIGPTATGYISVVSWRWSYWLQLVLAGITWPFFLMVPETYGPILLYKRAKQLRKSGNENVIARMELEQRDLRTLAVVTLTRPVRMFFREAIVLSSCLYMATIYAIFYMYLQAFTIIYQGVYNFNAGEVGLTFLPISLGSFLACGVYLWWEAYLDRRGAERPPPAWTQKEEYCRVSLACLAGPFMVVSIFWLAWSARADVHWIVPVLSSIPFGLAYVLIYIGLVNYLVDAYEIYAASALAASSCSRSTFGVVLPFAVPSMFQNLGIAWAVSALGFISLLFSLLPFLFLRYGDRLRANSIFCQELKRLKEEKAANRS